MRHSRYLTAITLSFATAVAACGSGGVDRTFDDGSQGGLGGGGGSGSLDQNTPKPGPKGDETCAAQVTSATRALVDIIILIDTSASMSEETAQVKANINTFASKIGSSGLDYTVVMIAEKPIALPLPLPGGPPGICVPPPLGGADCTDNAPTFHHINHGVSSTNSLQVILDKYSTYAPWLRPDAYKVFIEVTDDNASLAWSSFDNQLLAKSSALFGSAASRKYIFNSICGWKKGTPVLDSSKCGSAVNIGDNYQNLSKVTGGTVDSVCETSYAGVFDNIAKGLITRLGCEFAMPKAADGKVADPSRVVVNYTPGGGGTRPLTQVTDASKCGTIADAWYYDDNGAPSRIIFCPTTCTSAGQDTGGKLEIAVGCAAPPPK